MNQQGRVRRFFDSLPEPDNWTPWIKFTIVQTGAFKPFLQQCLENTTSSGRSRQGRPQRSSSGKARNQGPEGSSTPLARALSWQRLARLHYRTVICVYLLLLAKYRLIGMVTGHFRFLDCLILGRLRFVGRLTKISGEFACLFILCYLTTRASINLLEPKFKFYALEFLMSSRAEVLCYEISELRDEFQRREICVPEQQRPRSACFLAAPSVGGPEVYPGHRPRLLTVSSANCQQEERATRRRVLRSPARVRNSIAYLRSPFTCIDVEARWILRLNRTAKCWATLNYCTKILFYWSVYMATTYMALIYYLQPGSILTNFGFEMSYPACVAWLRDIQADPSYSDSNNYSHIYLAPKVLAHDYPIDEVPARIPLDTQDLQQINVYTIARITMDILENHIIYMEGIGMFVCQFYILIIHSIDVVLNAAEIELRLIGLLAKLETRRLHFSPENLDPPPARIHRFGLITISPLWAPSHAHHLFRPPETRLGGGGNRQHTMPAAHDNQLREEISDLQAILADQFYTITQGYNLYISFLLGVVGLCWLLYTVIVCVWISSNRSRAVELEFIAAEVMVTLFCSTLSIGAALVRSRNLQLYQLITRAMAIDPDWSVTKPRWTSILKYFYPKPFHCFTIFGSVELSVLLGLKVS